MKKLEASSRSGLSQRLRLRNRLQAFISLQTLKFTSLQEDLGSNGSDWRQLLESVAPPTQASPPHASSQVCAGASNELTWRVLVETTPFSKV